MSDLLVIDHTPALGTGSDMRTYAVARALAAHGPLDILHPRFGDAGEPDRVFRDIEGVRIHSVTPSRGLARALAYGRARAAGVPRAFARGISPELVGTAARLAAAADRVIADGPTVAAALVPLARRRPVLYNAHNLESAFRLTLGADDYGGARRLERFERGLLEAMAEAWMVSPGDLEGARALCPTAHLRYVPNAVDTASIAPVAPHRGGPALMVADFTYSPNENGLRYLAAEVLPRVPDVRLLVAGRGLASPPDDDRVTALGFVDDLEPLYAGASCAVVPLLEGGGSPLKFVEALAHGLPVVATPRAAAGLEVTAGEHYLPGADPEEFAAGLRRALAGEADEIGRAGRRLAEARYSIEALAEAVAPAQRTA